MTEFVATIRYVAHEPTVDLIAAAFVLRICIATVSLWAGFGKIAAPSQVRRSLARYRLLPRWVNMPAAYLLIASELLIGIFLLAGLQTRVVAVASAVVFVTYVIAIFVALLRGQDIPCGCFGEERTERVSWAGLMRSLALAIGSAGLAVLADMPWPEPQNIAPLILIAVALAVGLRLLGLLPQAVAALRAPVVIPATARHRTRFRHIPLDVPIQALLDPSRSVLQLGPRGESSRPEVRSE